MAAPDARLEPSAGRTVDFDIAGTVGLRLVGADEKDGAGVKKRLGRYHATLTREPDIVVRFADEPLVGPMTLLGLNDMGFDDDGFYLLDGISGVPQVRIPFDQIGQRCEIVVPRGSGGVPLLLEVIRLTFLRKDFIPVHASAFKYDGRGVLVMGWAKGGKTEMLLSFAQRGAEYVGDEWVMVSRDGQRMIGLPVLVAMRDWQLPYIRDLVPRIGLQRRLMFGGIRLLNGLHRVLHGSALRDSASMELFDRALPKIREQNKIKQSPERIFPRLARDLESQIDKVFLIMSHAQPEIVVRPCEGREIARRMAHSNAAELMPFVEQYEAFAFAFPHRTNPFLEQAADLQGQLLQEALAGKEAYAISHPYPVSIPALFEGVKPFC